MTIVLENNIVAMSNIIIIREAINGEIIILFVITVYSELVSLIVNINTPIVSIS